MITGWGYVSNPLKKCESQLGWWHSQSGKIKNVPNHQPRTLIHVTQGWIHLGEEKIIDISYRVIDN